MTATVSPVRLMSPAAMRFGVWRSLASQRADAASAGWQADASGPAAGRDASLAERGDLRAEHPAEHGSEPGPEYRAEWLLARRLPVPPGVLSRWWLMASVLGLTAALGSWMLAPASVQALHAVIGVVALSLAGRLALWTYGRHALDHDHIAMSSSRVHVACSRAGRTVSLDVHPRWVRVEPLQHDRSLICLSGEGRRVTLGEFVPTDSRRQLAEELRWALRHLDD